MKLDDHGWPFADLRQDRALGFLDAEGHTRLRELEGDDHRGPDGYEIAAAAILLTSKRPLEPLPDDLHEQLRRTLSDLSDPSAS